MDVVNHSRGTSSVDQDCVDVVNHSRGTSSVDQDSCGCC